MQQHDPLGDQQPEQVADFAITAGAGDIDATGPVKVVIRPERVRLEPYRDASDGDAVDSSNRIPAMIERAVYLGSVTHLILRLAPGETLQAMALVTYSESTKFTKVTKVGICRTRAIFVLFVSFVDQENRTRYRHSSAAAGRLSPARRSTGPAALW